MMLIVIRRLWFPIAAIIPTVTFLLLGLFSGPSADDYCYAQMSAEQGYFGALKENYFSWQGRYASSGILFFSGYLDPSTLLHWYWLVPTSLIVAIALSAYVLLQSLNRVLGEVVFKRSQVVIASIVLTDIYLISLDRPSQVVYWWAGSVTYQLANILFTLLIAALVNLYIADSRRKRWLLFSLSGLLVCIVVGCNETTMAACSLLLGFYLLWSCYFPFANQGSEQKLMAACLLIIGIIGSSVVILAPGNQIRIQYEASVWGWHRANSPFELIKAALGATIWGVINSSRWLFTQPYHWFAILLGLVSSSVSGRVHAITTSRRLLWLPLITFILILAAVLPSFYVGAEPPERTISSVYVILWLSFIPSGVVLMKYYGWDLRGRGVVTAMKVGLVGSMLLSPHYVTATQDFKDAILYRLQLQERQTLVADAIQKGYSDIVVPKLTRLPVTLHFRDLSEDESYYYNKCYASYVGIRSIIAHGEGDASRIGQRFKDKLKSQFPSLVSGLFSK